MVNFAVAPGSQPKHDLPRLVPTKTEYHSAPIQAGGRTAAGLNVLSLAPGGSGLSYKEVYRITGELPSGYWLHYAIPVYVRLEGSEFVASQPQLAIMAFGDSPADAILNLRADLVEHYERLLELGDRLGPQLVRQRDFMRKLFTRRDA
jgi:hypothetical protein